MIAGPCLPTLTAQRVKLRWLVPADVQSLYDVFSNDDVMRYWSRPPFTRVEEARELVEAIERAFAQKSLYQWGVARADDDRVIGTCTLSSVDASNLRAELGYALGREHWGRGLMGEALARLLDFSFEELGMRRLEADVDPNNAASIALLERLGFRREGYLRERWFVGGQVQDSLFYGLLRREWAARRGTRA
jgi:RimJ/RimL family protein N-acetyltransferase